MKVRIGYVTNSSSTNFLILTKKTITKEFLYEKLGFMNNSPLKEEALELCENIISSIDYAPTYFSFDEVSYNLVERLFGKYYAEKFKEKTENGYQAHVGYTQSDDGAMTGFFTTDTFEIEDQDFYINARSCMW